MLELGQFTCLESTLLPFATKSNLYVPEGSQLTVTDVTFVTTDDDGVYVELKAARLRFVVGALGAFEDVSLKVFEAAPHVQHPATFALT
jgi:hypothetical protein